MTINTQKLRDLIRRAAPLPWTLATSNSWRRIVDPYHVPVCSPCTQSDGHPDLAFPGGPEGPTAQLLIEAANALPGLLDIFDAANEQVAEYARIAEQTRAEADARIDAQAAEIARLREALAELVACDDLKRRIAIEQDAIIPETDDDIAELDRLMTDLAQRRPKAWESARAALAQEGS